MKKDRVRLARIRSPQQDKVGFRDLLVGARAAARSEDRRQTDDARSVSRSVAAVDVVAADDDASEFLRDEVYFVGRLRTAEHSVRMSTVALARAAQCGGGAIERFAPRCAAQRLSLMHI